MKPTKNFPESEQIVWFRTWEEMEKYYISDDVMRALNDLDEWARDESGSVAYYIANDGRIHVIPTPEKINGI